MTPESARPADDVLPPLPEIEGLERLRRVEDLLTDEQKAKLRADLAEMARLRRRAEAEAANLVLGAHNDGADRG
ncbi:MAG: hypothetical protein ABR532_01540 [Candidatus Dormibacteria bacterium]